MLKKTTRVLREIAGLYSEKQIPRAAAALSYYLTMTVFPLVICLYTLLGNNYVRAFQVLDFVEQFLSAETTRLIKTFLDYVARNHSSAMLIAGLTVLVTSASAGIRSLQGTIGEIQGGRRFQGLMDYAFSLMLSLVFLAAMYFAIVVTLTGRTFLEYINGLLPFVDISGSWHWVRFLLLGGIEYVIFCGLYQSARRKAGEYPCYPGALLATVGVVLMSSLFSVFIAVSARYPLVYGSLASLILLMYWLFLCCQVICLMRGHPLK